MNQYGDDIEEPRAATLLWGDQRRPGNRGPNPALTLLRIVREAVAIADAEGLAALSMPRLAKQLGAGTMSLYRYVPGKEELVALMLDTVVGNPPDLPRGDWRAALERWGRGNRDIFRHHPWALAVVMGNRIMGPNETAWGEAALAALAGSGLPPDVALNAMVAVNGYVRGATQAEIDPGRGRDQAGHSGPSLDPALLVRFGREDRYPMLMAMLTTGTQLGAGEHAAAAAGQGFEFGLQCLLDGIAAAISRQGRASTSPKSSTRSAEVGKW